METQVRRRRLGAGLVLGAVLAFGLALGEQAVGRAESSPRPAVTQAGADSQSAPANGGAQPTTGYVGAETCLTCHADKESDGYANSPHARAANPRTPAAAQGCETCHGPGGQHVEDPAQNPMRRFDVVAPREVSDTCTTCHNRGEHAWWQGSAHDTRNLSCSTCHSVHEFKSERAQLKAASVIETCETCHRPQAMKIQRTAHMPLREGKMDCATCHNPHGSTNVKQLRQGQWVNESCVSCHAEKRGPFLFEHAAGREACSTCHDPHGSNNERLLVAKLPMLCQRCHIGTRHPSTIYDGAQLAGSSNRIIGRSCVNCHSNIHGSNHPSGHSFLR